MNIKKVIIHQKFINKMRYDYYTLIHNNLNDNNEKKIQKYKLKK